VKLRQERLLEDFYLPSEPRRLRPENRTSFLSSLIVPDDLEEKAGRAYTRRRSRSKHEFRPRRFFVITRRNPCFEKDSMEMQTGMLPASILELADVSGQPKVKLVLPAPLRLGDVLNLNFRLRRQTGGRTEALEVNGRFKVTSVGFDATQGLPRQLLVVEATGVTPIWRAIKNTPPFVRQLSPTHYPRTTVA
jgi:hypothetical protein